MTSTSSIMKYVSQFGLNLDAGKKTVVIWKNFMKQCTKY